MLGQKKVQKQPPKDYKALTESMVSVPVCVNCGLVRVEEDVCCDNPAYDQEIRFSDVLDAAKRLRDSLAQRPFIGKERAKMIVLDAFPCFVMYFGDEP